MFLEKDMKTEKVINLISLTTMVAVFLMATELEVRLGVWEGYVILIPMILIHWYRWDEIKSSRRKGIFD